MLRASMEDAREPVGRLAYVAYEFPVPTQTFTRAEVAGLARAGLDVFVIACRPARGGADAGIPVEVLPRTPVGAFFGWLLRRPWRTLDLLRRVAFARYRDQAFRCRLRGLVQLMQGAALARRIRRERGRGGGVHLHAQFVDAASTVAWVAARLADVPFSVTNHTAYNPYLIRDKLRDADRFFSISEFDRRLTLSMAGIEDAPNLRVVRLGIDLDRFRFREPRPAGETAALLSVAALREKKGHHLLIRAAAILRDRDFPFRLVIVGEGPERSRLEALVREFDLEALVEFAGAESPDRVIERLDGADLFVLACTTASNGDLDGIPVSLMEAMAAGVPVVSTRLSGIPELIEDGRSGRLVEPDDPEALADAIAETLADPDAAAGRAREARRTVEERHDFARCLDEMVAGLREVLP